MSDTLSRRQLLQAAGGITFLALVPNGRGAFALSPEMAHEMNVAPTTAAPLPQFTALPYIQPGPLGILPKDGAESIVLTWQTDDVPAEFAVTLKGKNALATPLSPVRTERYIGKSEAEGRWNYFVAVPNLALATRYEYTVKMNGKTIAEGYFTTRKPRGTKTRFVTFGDNSYGDISDRMIAYQAYQAHPDFIMNTGDNVYEGGLDNEYARYFFPVYNADTPSPNVGAPLLRSVPFYTVMANHDVHGKDADGHPAADFKTDPDSLAYFTALHLPLTGHDQTQKPTITGPDDAIAVFKKAAGDRFPRMANYSYDYGDAHFLCLDSNIYVDANDAALHAFIEKDLNASNAAWKFVVYHHPAFNVGYDHYAEQHMRVLSPIFEKCKVDMVFHGHEHNYQRTMPFKFAPKDTKGASNVNTKNRLVPGTFTIDKAFDGVKQTKADGIIYVTTGAGGKHLYDKEDGNNPAKWTHPEDGNVAYVARYVTDRHSLTVVDMDAKSLEVTQVDQWGNVVDKFRLTK